MTFFPSLNIFFLLLITGLLDIFIALFVISQKRTTFSANFALWSCFVGLWSIFVSLMNLGIDQYLSIFGFKAAAWAGSFIPFLFLIISFVFPDKKISIAKMLLFVLAIPAIIFAISSFTDIWLFYILLKDNSVMISVDNRWSLAYLLYFTLYLLYGTVHLYKEFTKTFGSRRQQFIYLFTGLFITFMFGIFCTILPVFLGIGKYLYFGPLGAIFFITLTAYAITKHEFMDIKVAITRGAAYGTTGFLLVVSFMALNLLQMPRMIMFAANTVLCLFWLFSANKLRSLIQTPLEEKWITGWYDPNKLMNRIAQELVPAMETSKVFEIIEEQLKNTIKIREIKVFDNTDLNIPVNEVVRYDNLSPELKEKFKGFVNGIFIPLASSSESKGILGLSQKVSEDPYNEKDVLLFNTIMFQAVAIFDRVRSYEQIKHEFDSTQKKLFETEKMLSRSARLASLGTLTAGVTHEIRNPLGVIRMGMNLLAKEPRDEKYLKEWRDLHIKHVDRIADIIDKMLHLSRAKEAVNKVINVNDLIKQYIVGIVSSKNVNISTDLKPIPDVSAIEDDLHQVLINLTNNAIKAMPNGGNLTIQTYEAEENGSRKVIIEVSDTGIGISVTNIEKIFDPFFSTWENGTGLGLSISYKIIEELKGRIEVQSQVGKGSTFKITLPAA